MLARRFGTGVSSSHRITDTSPALSLSCWDGVSHIAVGDAMAAAVVVVVAVIVAVLTAAAAVWGHEIR